MLPGHPGIYGNCRDIETDRGWCRGRHGRRTMNMCQNCKYWEYEYEHTIDDVSVGCCNCDEKYKDITFGCFDDDSLFNASDLPSGGWWCSMETDGDDYCKYWEGL